MKQSLWIISLNQLRNTGDCFIIFVTSTDVSQWVSNIMYTEFFLTEFIWIAVVLVILFCSEIFTGEKY